MIKVWLKGGRAVFRIHTYSLNPDPAKTLNTDPKHWGIVYTGTWDQRVVEADTEDTRAWSPPHAGQEASLCNTDWYN